MIILLFNFTNRFVADEKECYGKPTRFSSENQAVLPTVRIHLYWIWRFISRYERARGLLCAPQVLYSLRPCKTTPSPSQIHPFLRIYETGRSVPSQCMSLRPDVCGDNNVFKILLLLGIFSQLPIKFFIFLSKVCFLKSFITFEKYVYTN